MPPQARQAPSRDPHQPAAYDSTQAAPQGQQGSQDSQGQHDPQSLWRALLEKSHTKPALGWIRSLNFVRMDGGVAHLALKPGQREMVRFFGERQRGQLSQMLSELAGQQIKVELQMPTQQMLDETDQGGHDHRGSAGGGGASAGSGGQSGSGRSAISAAQRQTVMGLPLVRELMASFDLSLVEVRKHTPLAPKTSDDDSDEDSDTPSTKKSALDDIDPLAASDTLDDMDDSED